MAANRGCGSRIKGGIYMTTDVGPNGLPLEHFLYCPAIPIPPTWTIPDRGVLPIRLNDSLAIVDKIGTSFYPNVCDFLEEGRRFGFSRHINMATALRLNGASRFLPAHARALINNWVMYPPRNHALCPRDRHPAREGDRTCDWFVTNYPEYLESLGAYPVHKHEGCSGYWWEDVQEGEPDGFEERSVIRTIGDSTYSAWSRPDGIAYDYDTGIIASLPIHAVHVIDGDKSSEISFRRLMDNVDLPVLMMQE